MYQDKLKEKILNDYLDGGKHSQYQNFPKFVSDEFGIVADIDETWRGDTARYDYISKYLEQIQYESLVDIGANTGKFCLELAHTNKDKTFFAYEINSNYIDLINCIKQYFDMNNIKAINEAADKEGLSKIEECDVMLHMNVLHHAGVDFDARYVMDIEMFEEYAVEYLKLLSDKCNRLVFQLGYNWGGNKERPIVDTNNISGMIKFGKMISENSDWTIERVALYNRKECKYVEVDGNNYIKDIERLDMINNSEFYKRPIFILKSKKRNK